MTNLYKLFFKRALDFLISFLVIIILSPVYLIITILLFFLNQGSPFFIQKRPGQHEKEIYVLKFKTMNDKKDSSGKLLPDKERVSTVGKILRASSLDELPQLLNVLKGDMSLVGPRPLLFEYIPLHIGEQAKRYEARPGITGWAQVNGRNTISWTKKFEYDVWYVKNMSFVLDCKIILLTIKKVFIREGVEFDKPQEIRRFNGDN